MADTEEKFKQASERFIKIVRNQTEENTGNTIGLVVLKCSGSLDQMSVSLLVVAGAVLTLCISNASDILSVISGNGYTWMMSLFMLSAMFGFFAKASYTVANFHISLHRELFMALDELVEKFKTETQEMRQSAIDNGVELNTFFPRGEKTKEALIKTFPFHWRPYLLKRMSVSNSDGDKSSLLVAAWKFVTFQFFGFLTQIVLFILGVIVAVVGFAS